MQLVQTEVDVQVEQKKMLEAQATHMEPEKVWPIGHSQIPKVDMVVGFVQTAQPELVHDVQVGPKLPLHDTQLFVVVKR